MAAIRSSKASRSSSASSAFRRSWISQRRTALAVISSAVRSATRRSRCSCASRSLRSALCRSAISADSCLLTLSSSRLLARMVRVRKEYDHQMRRPMSEKSSSLSHHGGGRWRHWFASTTPATCFIATPPASPERLKLGWGLSPQGRNLRANRPRASTEVSPDLLKATARASCGGEPSPHCDWDPGLAISTPL